MTTDAFVTQRTARPSSRFKDTCFLGFPPTPPSQDHSACSPAHAFISSTAKGETSGLYLSELDKEKLTKWIFKLDTHSFKNNLELREGKKEMNMDGVKSLGQE